MQRLLKITAFLLLAIWLPATLHCDLEAAGFAEAHHASSGSDQECADNICPTIESSLIRESAPALNLTAPIGCDCFLCFSSFLAYACDHPAEPVLSPDRQAPPLEIAAGWQFLIRAAPPSRAPSLNT